MPKKSFTDLLCLVDQLLLLLSLCMFNIKFLTLLVGLFSFYASGQSTRFFVSAHQDDWQLFMNPNVYESIKSEADKNVIIHTTAGEAGMGLGHDAYI